MIKHKGGKSTMGWQVWAIIILLAVSFYQYNSPEKANAQLKVVWGPVKDFIGNNNPLSGNKSESGICPTTEAPVCGTNGVTYRNMCEAALADILQVTPGAC